MKRTIILLALALAGCGGVASAPPTILDPDTSSQTFVKGVGYDTVRIEDYEAGVVCYVHDNPGSYGAALSCLPMNQTNLGGDR